MADETDSSDDMTVPPDLADLDADTLATLVDGYEGLRQQARQDRIADPDEELRAAAREAVLDELTAVFDRGDVTFMQAFDYWLVEEHGLKLREAGAVRDASHQTVWTNLQYAKHEFGEREELPESLQDRDEFTGD